MRARLVPLFGVFLVILVYVVGIWSGRRGVKVQTITRIDTVYYERPREYRATERRVSVRVPRMMFAANDDTSTSYGDTSTRNDDTSPGESVTSCNDLPKTVKTDSVNIEVVERTVEYRDSTYYARVVGPVVGTISPRLDFIRTYTRNTVQTVTKRPRFAITAGVGVGWTPHGIEPQIGIQAGWVLWSK